MSVQAIITAGACLNTAIELYRELAGDVPTTPDQLHFAGRADALQATYDRISEAARGALSGETMGGWNAGDAGAQMGNAVSALQRAADAEKNPARAAYLHGCVKALDATREICKEERAKLEAGEPTWQADDAECEEGLTITVYVGGNAAQQTFSANAIGYESRNAHATSIGAILSVLGQLHRNDPDLDPCCITVEYEHSD